MQRFKSFIVLALISGIVGCASTGGTIGGLIPAPKFTKGKIQNNTYTSKDEDFSISIPHKDGTYEFSYMRVKEQYNEKGAYISFGPAATDQSIYRLEVGRKLTPQNNDVILEEAVDVFIEDYSTQLESGYRTKPKITHKEKIKINNVDSYVVKLTQQVDSITLTHEAIITDYKKFLVGVWVQKSSESFGTSTLDVYKFAESFKAINNSHILTQWNEKIIVDIDEKIWSLEYQKAKPGYGYIRDWIPKGGDINNWSRLVSIELDEKEKRTAHVYGEKQSAFWARKCPGTTFELLEETDKSVIYFFSFPNCEGHETHSKLEKLIHGKNGLHKLSYSEKGRVIKPVNKARWLEKLGNAYLEEIKKSEGHETIPYPAPRNCIWIRDSETQTYELEC